MIPPILLPPTQEILAPEIENGQSWIHEYREVDSNTIFVRKWKDLSNNISAIALIRQLPDCQKPQLPEGYLFLEEGDQLKILVHKDTPFTNVKIYLFGPDDKGRLSYLVEHEETPIHGYAMTRAEGFPKGLRDKYPVTLNSYTTLDGTKYWRGHIIDLQDTLGPITDKNISTIFSVNFKPEPYKTWAETLRKYIVQHLRKDGGSYGEMMLHHFVPSRTKGGAAIPQAVFFEAFTSDMRRLKSYYAPREHECHQWKKQPKEKNFALNSSLKLESNDDFTPLVIKKDSPSDRAFLQECTFDQDLSQLDIKTAFHLRRYAEVEFNQATHQLKYLLYAKTHQAPSVTLHFWMKRAVSIASKVDAAYGSKKPAFPLDLMNRITDVFKASFLEENRSLKDLFGRLQVITTNVTTALLRPRTPPAIDPTTINCQGVNPRSACAVKALMGRITLPINKGSAIILTNLSSEMANQILPQIENASEKPLKSVTVIDIKYKKTITMLVRKLFGDNVPVI
jgi:hypothetical protein